MHTLVDCIVCINIKPKLACWIYCIFQHKHFFKANLAFSVSVVFLKSTELVKPHIYNSRRIADKTEFAAAHFSDILCFVFRTKPVIRKSEVKLQQQARQTFWLMLLQVLYSTKKQQPLNQYVVLCNLKRKLYECIFLFIQIDCLVYRYCAKSGIKNALK